MYQLPLSRGGAGGRQGEKRAIAATVTTSSTAAKWAERDGAACCSPTAGQERRGHGRLLPSAQVQIELSLSLFSPFLRGVSVGRQGGLWQGQHFCSSLRSPRTWARPAHINFSPSAPIIAIQRNIFSLIAHSFRWRTSTEKTNLGLLQTRSYVGNCMDAACNSSCNMNAH